MNHPNTTFVTGPTVRQIAVNRNDGVVEFKTWLVYEVRFPEAAQRKIRAFVLSEEQRVRSTDLSHLSSAELIASAADFQTLIPTSTALPARLVTLDEPTLLSLPTELCAIRGVTFGDSVGGIAPGRGPTHNEHLLLTLPSLKQDVIFSPGLLCRIPVTIDGTRVFVFQLAEKNLRLKGDIFYKPIGGHLTYTPKFESHIRAMGLRPKPVRASENPRDVSFFVPPQNIVTLRELFLSEILAPTPVLFRPPSETLRREISEELGPTHSLDGVCLLTAEEVGTYDFQTH